VSDSSLPASHAHAGIRIVLQSLPATYQRTNHPLFLAQRFPAASCVPLHLIFALRGHQRMPHVPFSPVRVFPTIQAIPSSLPDQIAPV